MNITVINIQLALFFQEPINRPDKLISPINENLKDLFDSAPIMLPSKDAPINVPLIQLSSENKKYNCNIANNRIDFFFNPIIEISDFSDIQNEIEQKEKLFIKAIYESTEISGLNRIGHVIRYFIEDENPTETLKKSYFKKELGNLKDLKIKYTNDDSFMGFSINNITQLLPGGRIIENVDKKGLVSCQ